LKKAATKPRKRERQVATLVRGPLNRKARGAVGELAFAQKAASLGFGVAKPYADNERYDFILDSGERFWRVQVKTIWQVHGHLYQTSVTHGHGVNTRSYTASEIDFVVVYLAPLDIWYVIPVNCVTGSTSLCFYPSGCRHDGGRLEPYREAWHLMAPGGDASPRPGILPRVHAMACELSVDWWIGGEGLRSCPARLTSSRSPALLPAGRGFSRVLTTTATGMARLAVG
jgi:PD-(D/E)XK endonuclease